MYEEFWPLLNNYYVSEKSRVNECIISTNNNNILHVPGGFANGFRSLFEDSRLVVFSSGTLEESIEDDYKFEANSWCNWIRQGPWNLDIKWTNLK